MTHWMIRLRNSAFVKSLEFIKERIGDAYHQRPREFLEHLSSLIFSFALMIWIIQFLGLYPLPVPVRITNPQATPAEVFGSIKPLLLHAFALFGTVYIIQWNSFVYYYIHGIDSVIVKIYRYQKFVRIGRGKISR